MRLGMEIGQGDNVTMPTSRPGQHLPSRYLPPVKSHATYVKRQPSATASSAAGRTKPPNPLL